MTPAQEYRLGVRAAAGIIAGLCGLCGGCLTASKIKTWESALVGWARKGGPECVAASKVASKYLMNANRTLQDATSAADVQSDGEATKLMTEAAAKCGEVVP